MEAAELNLKIKNLVTQLAGETDAVKQSQLFTDYLRISAAFHNYSWHNSMLIWSQKPAARRVMGFRQWLGLNRWVRKGEQGIAILAPCFPKKAEREQSETLPAVDAGQPRKGAPVYFRPVYVFDISQTDGAELPELPYSVTGDAGNLAARLESFAVAQGGQVAYQKLEAGHHGYCNPRTGEIVVSTELSRESQAATLIHEVSHLILHSKLATVGERPASLAQRELEAEATSFVVCAHFGLNLSSQFYLAQYGVTGEMLTASLGMIQRSSKAIIEAVTLAQQLELVPAQQPQIVAQRMAA